MPPPGICSKLCSFVNSMAIISADILLKLQQSPTVVWHRSDSYGAVYATGGNYYRELGPGGGQAPQA
ncbi:hypothetical protein AB1N83_006284 [Pleurotus pulmonarius]